MGDRKSRGREGEEKAVRYLVENGYKIEHRNFIFSHGEIDIVARGPDGCLAFIEVKYRTNRNFGDPEYSVTQGKQRQIRKVAEAYYYIKKLSDCSCRFDVIIVTEFPGEDLEITHYTDAFR